MFHTRVNALAIGLAALLVAVTAPATGRARTGAELTGRAAAFVHELARGEFKAAEADFTGQMRQAAPPRTLRQTWRALIKRFGAFGRTGAHKTVVQGGYTTVIVATDFKNRTLGFAVSFDSADRIAGVHVVPAP